MFGAGAVPLHFGNQAVDAGVRLNEVLDEAVGAEFLLCGVHSLGDAVGIEEQFSAGTESNGALRIRGRS